MFRTLLVCILMGAFLAACTGSQPADDNDTPVSSTDSPMEEPAQQPPGGPLNNSYLPQADDSKFTRGEAFLDSTDLLIMESYPVQISLALKGSLPTPCNQLRVVANPPDEQNRIQVEVYSVIDPEQMCIQVLEPFEANINLGSFPTGHYTVWVNGKQVGEFDS